MKKLLLKLPYYKLPMSVKIFTAKILLRMFRGFGDTLQNDLILYNRLNSFLEELELWIKTDGRPTTSNPNYLINTLNP